MRGVITTWSVLRHPIIVVQEYGWRIFATCIIAGLLHQKRTFLNIINGV